MFQSGFVCQEVRQGIGFLDFGQRSNGYYLLVKLARKGFVRRQGM